MFINYTYETPPPLWQQLPAPAPLNRVADFPSSAIVCQPVTSTHTATLLCMHPTYLLRTKLVPSLVHLHLHLVWHPPLGLTPGMASPTSPQHFFRDDCLALALASWLLSVTTAHSCSLLIFYTVPLWCHSDDTWCPNCFAVNYHVYIDEHHKRNGMYTPIA